MTQLHQAIQNIQDIIHKYTLKQQQIITLLHSKQHKIHNTSRTHHKKLYVLYQKHIQQLQQQIIIHTHYICQIEHMHITYSHVHALKHTQLYLQKQQDIHKLQHIIQHVHTQLQHIQDVGELLNYSVLLYLFFHWFVCFYVASRKLCPRGIPRLFTGRDSINGPCGDHNGSHLDKGKYLTNMVQILH